MTQGASPAKKWGRRSRAYWRRQRRRQAKLGGRPLTDGERRQISQEGT
jgi:hypothetical protein